MKKHGINEGTVCCELNDALEVLRGLMPDFVTGFVYKYELYFINERRSVARAKVTLNNGREVNMAFKWEYPFPPEILAAKFSMFMGRSSGVSFLKELQRIAGPINWLFDPFESKTEDAGTFSFRLKRRNLDLLDYWAGMLEAGGETFSWDDPNHFSNKQLI